MSLTYGYDLKEGDDMIAAPVQAGEMMSRATLPGAALVNIFPFCAVSLASSPWQVTHPFSEIYPFMGTMVQLRTIGTKGKEAK